MFILCGVDVFLPGEHVRFIGYGAGSDVGQLSSPESILLHETLHGDVLLFVADEDNNRVQVR
jgi:hypothetical protein